MADGVLYLSTPLYRAVAIDARAGETLWVYDPRAYESGTPAEVPWSHRGVAYWEQDGDVRIVWATGDGYLIAVDAKTGLPAADFGEDGRVDLTVGLPRAPRGQRDVQNLLQLSSHSPPMVVRDTVIVGSTIKDITITREATPGWVRAYDVRTGQHKWDFHTVPQSADEFGADTWLDEAWRYSGNTNVWSMMSADAELGLVYLPIGTPTSDYYGGHRLGDNLFAESLVAVDVETGQRQWHFQMVHHGLWDYDNPAAPNLMDITVNGRPVKAVAQVTKQGFVYAFDRVTGEPIWPIEERPVPTDTDLDGEVPSRTQPFPTKPAPFEYQGTSIDDLVEFHTGGQTDGAGGGRRSPSGSALHAQHPAWHDHASEYHRWCELVWRGPRSRNRASVRDVSERRLGHEVPRGRTRRASDAALRPPPGCARSSDAEGAAAVEAPVFTRHGDRYEFGGPCVDDTVGER